MNRVRIYNRSRSLRIAPEHPRKLVSRALFLLGEREAAVEVNLLSDEEMRRLNRTFLKKDKPTNVLSFPVTPFPRQGPRPLGEIYLAPAHITRRGEDFRLLVLHGLLHLLGYNHKKKNDRIRMEKKERWLAKRLIVS